MVKLNDKSTIIEPLFTELRDIMGVVLVACIVTLIFSGMIIKATLGKSAGLRTDRAGWIMGKAENVIVVLFCVVGEFTGIAILISAKAIVRKTAGKPEDTSYRVAGTLVNLAWGLVMGLTARVLIFGL